MEVENFILITESNKMTKIRMILHLIYSQVEIKF